MIITVRCYKYANKARFFLSAIAAAVFFNERTTCIADEMFAQL